MKYRVVGWTEFDDMDVEEAEDCNEAALQAIVKDIREHNYEFNGYEHQEFLLGAPVLNDGKKRTFTQREFGGVMAKAHGDHTLMGYAYYAFCEYGGDSLKRMPGFDRSFDSEGFTPETDLNEEITVEVSEEELKEAENGSLTLADREELMLIYDGDILTLTSGESRASYLVKEMYRKKNLSCEELERVFSYGNRDDELVKKYDEADWVVVLELEKKS